MKCTHVISLIFGSVLSLVTLASAQVPQMINYQGRVAVGDPQVNFDGTGQFKFALVNGGANLNVQLTVELHLLTEGVSDHLGVERAAH